MPGELASARSAELCRLIEADRDEISRREAWRPAAFSTPAGQAGRAELISARGAAGECLHYVIRTGGALVGTGGLELRGDGLAAGEAELGYWIAQPFRGLGLATRAARLVLEEAARRGIRRIRANVHPDNLASHAVLGHLGFPGAVEVVLLDDGTGVAHPYLRGWLIHGATGHSRDRRAAEVERL